MYVSWTSWNIVSYGRPILVAAFHELLVHLFLIFLKDDTNLVKFGFERTRTFGNEYVAEPRIWTDNVTKLYKLRLSASANHWDISLRHGYTVDTYSNTIARSANAI